jgi:protein-S-isoprenylcysteine O-methyltransferase Ste14
MSAAAFPSSLYFRLAVFLLFAIPMGYWAMRTLRGHRGRFVLFSSRESLGVAILFRALQAASAVSFLLYLVRPELIAFADLSFPLWPRLLGLVPALLGGLALVWVLRTLADNFSSTLELRKDHELVTGGPYGIVRHPMYDSFILLWTGYFLLSANWMIGGTGLAAQALIALCRTPREEKMMAESFGAAYEEYRGRTHGFIPFKLAGKKSRKEARPWTG